MHMRLLSLLIFALLATAGLSAQEMADLSKPSKPTYCEEAPNTYGTATDAPALPKFSTSPTREYKVQVAILRYTDPSEYPFHPTLVARYRPCEQVWVIESRQSFTNREEAVALQDTLTEAGYSGSYITDLIAYQ
jgi:hypothetical protein